MKLVSAKTKLLRQGLLPLMALLAIIAIACGAAEEAAPAAEPAAAPEISPTGGTGNTRYVGSCSPGIHGKARRINGGPAGGNHGQDD